MAALDALLAPPHGYAGGRQRVRALTPASPVRMALDDTTVSAPLRRGIPSWRMETEAYAAGGCRFRPIVTKRVGGCGPSCAPMGHLLAIGGAQVVPD
jgi:hypothetical protein